MVNVAQYLSCSKVFGNITRWRNETISNCMPNVHDHFRLKSNRFRLVNNPRGAISAHDCKKHNVLLDINHRYGYRNVKFRSGGPALNCFFPGEKYSKRRFRANHVSHPRDEIGIVYRAAHVAFEMHDSANICSRQNWCSRLGVGLVISQISFLKWRSDPAEEGRDDSKGN